MPPGAAQHRRFLEMWTAKEAVLKALGTGLSRDPRAVVVDPAKRSVWLDGRSGPVRSIAAGSFAIASDDFVWTRVVL